MKKQINGQIQTRDEAVVDNLKLVQKIAAKYEYKGKVSGLDYEDLVSFGTIGLMKAFDDFNDQLGYRFATYAVPKIKGEINKGISKSNLGLYYPISLRRCADMIQYHDLEALSAEEMAKVLKVSVNRVKNALDYIANSIPTSLDMTITDEDEKECSLVGDIVGKHQDFTQLFVEEFMVLLTEKEKEIVRMLLEKYSIKEIAAWYGNSRAAISYYLQDIRRKWTVYQEGSKVKGKRTYQKHSMEELLEEQELEEMQAQLERLRTRYG